MVSVIVTGATGFVGGHLVLGLASAGFKVIAVGGQKEFAPPVQKAAASCLSVDITDANAVSSCVHELRPDAIVHAAALARAETCEENPSLARQVNVQGTANLCHAASAIDAMMPFTFISTDLVFDGSTARGGGFSETDSPSPRSVYAKTKYDAEDAVLKQMRNGVIARVALVYGAPIGSATGFLGWILRSLGEGAPVKLFVDEWRTPIYAPDIAVAVSRMLDGRARTDRVFHLAGPDRLSRFQFGQLVCKKFGFDRTLLEPARQQDVPSKYARPTDVSLLTTNSIRVLGMAFSGCESGLSSLIT